jgi:hypothetical protein
VQDRHVTPLCILACSVFLLGGCKDAQDPKPATPETSKSEVSPPPLAANTQAEAPLSPGITVCGEVPELTEGVPGSPGKLIPSSINPNGQSQLAHLMREMLAELKLNKENAEKGKELLPLSIGKHGKVRCSWPTVESMRTGAFEPMARQYLGAVEKFNAGDKDPVAHNVVVSACITCHEATCDGPTIAIEAARFTGSPGGTASE